MKCSDVCEAGDRYLDEIFERIQTELNKRLPDF